MQFALIAAVDSKMGIGKAGRLPWHLPTDLKYFHDVTIGAGKNAVIMGRTTFETIPEKFRPLRERQNVVMTRDGAFSVPAGTEKAPSFEEALTLAEKYAPEKIFVIGGAQVFAEAISHPKCSEIFLTEIDGDFACDAFFPKFDAEKFKKIYDRGEMQENGIKFSFVKYGSI